MKAIAKNKMAYVAVFLGLLILPTMVFATQCKANSNVWSITILQGPLISCTGAGAPGGTDTANCKDLCDLVCTVANVAYFSIGVVLWIIMPIMVAWGGIMLMLSRGSSEGTGKARKMITATVIGLLITLCAYLIVYTFVRVVGISGIGGFSANTPSCIVLP